MKQTLKKIFLNNAQIKIISLILGYSFWHIVSQSHVTSIWLEAPICFYQKPQHTQIEAPEKIKIQLSGKRADLYTIDMETVAFHINIKNIQTGNKIIKITKDQLLLPETITLVRCYPANIVVSVKEKQTNI